MIFLVLIVLCVVVVVGVALVRSRRRGNSSDLGTISESWLAEQRAASYDVHR